MTPHNPVKTSTITLPHFRDEGTESWDSNPGLNRSGGGCRVQTVSFAAPPPREEQLEGASGGEPPAVYFHQPLLLSAFH